MLEKLDAQPGPVLSDLDITGLRADLVVARQDIATLHRALDSARRIGAAIGIIMASLKVSENDAFEVLRQASQRTNCKLRDIADDVVETGVIPG